jgi:methyl-accepting chemotaxis protein
VKWTIGQRITAGFATAIVLVVVVAAAALWTLERTERAYGDSMDVERTGLRQALQAQVEIRGANVNYLRYLLEQDAQFLTNYNREVESGIGNLVRLREAEVDAQLRGLWGQALDAANRWQDAANRSMAQHRAGNVEAAFDIRREEAQPARQSLDASMEQAVASAAERTEDSITAAQSLADRARTALLMVLALAVLLSILAAWLLDRAVRLPLHETSNVLASSATEILATTTQQATGAQESLAAVTQTAATADQVSQTAEQAAERARGVAGSAQKAAEIGRQGRQAVEESATAMAQVREQVDLISESIRALAEQAQAIGEINATVTDLSEQTNLLALNAAIEAARAGEQGRGFSVVAGEIKNLADQSKSATARVRQILNQIEVASDTAVQAADEGGRRVVQSERQVEQAGETIRALAEAIAGAAQAAAQISASAGQQSTGMAQIRQAISNIQHASQQNLAATRQAEAASRDLNQLSSRLLSLVGASSRGLPEA